MVPRAFISFQMKDRWARDLLVQRAKNQRDVIHFIDYSMESSLGPEWKANCQLRIAMTHGTIVLIGPTTYLSEAVAWEIAETLRQRNHIFGIQISRTNTYIVPQGLSPLDVVRWDFSSIAQKLNDWT